MAQPIPKHRTIFEAMRKQIETGKYAAGRRLPSEIELARRFGVSRPTAARALRDLQSLGILQRRVGSGTYLRSPTAMDDTSREHSVGLLVPGLGNTEILDPICDEITRFAEAACMSILRGEGVHGSASSQEAQTLCRRYIERDVAGVFFSPLESVPGREAINRRLADLLREAGIQVVLLDRDLLDFPQRSEFDLVGIDNFHAGLILADHLIRLGHRRFRFVARPHFPGTTDLRLAGCREAITRAGLKPECLHFDVGEPNTDFAKRMMGSDKPDAVICSNDRTAALLIQSLNQHGVRVPTDVAVVGFDDVRYATLLGTPLTTIRQPCRAIGDVAVATMAQRLANPSLPPRQVLLPVELVIRRSCGAKGQ